ncbi:hypothetical protein EON78_05150, partial [bacterium]
MSDSYSFSMNNPIVINDPTGREGEVSITRNPQGGGTVLLSATMFITGENAAATAAEAQKAFDANFKGNVGTYTDEHGNKWDL